MTMSLSPEQQIQQEFWQVYDGLNRAFARIRELEDRVAVLENDDNE